MCLQRQLGPAQIFVEAVPCAQSEACMISAERWKMLKVLYGITWVLFGLLIDLILVFWCILPGASSGCTSCRLLCTRQSDWALHRVPSRVWCLAEGHLRSLVHPLNRIHVVSARMQGLQVRCCLPSSCDKSKRFLIVSCRHPFGLASLGFSPCSAWCQVLALAIAHSKVTNLLPCLCQGFVVCLQESFGTSISS